MLNELTDYPVNDYTTRSQVRVLQLLMGGSIDKRRCAEAIVSVTGKAYKYLSVRSAVAAALYAAHGSHTDTSWKNLEALYKEKRPKFIGVNWKTSLKWTLSGVSANDTLYSRFSLGDVLKMLNIEQRESFKALVKNCQASMGQKLSTKTALTTVEHILWYSVSKIMSKDNISAVDAFDLYIARMNNPNALKYIESKAFEYFGWDPLSHPSSKDIRSVYRSLSRRLHPDRGGSLKAFQEFSCHKDNLEHILFPEKAKPEEEVA